jgi:uncharacterized protein YqgC (DUF456 family)
MTAVIVLAVALLASLLIVPLGLPGLWLMVGVALLFDAVVAGVDFGLVVLVGVTALALVAELVEFGLGGRIARRYGGSRRAEWGAIGGGLAGAIVGVPVPVIGPMIGAFVGAFAGALVAELSLIRGAMAATRVATGALVGRALAVVVKLGIGAVMAVWLVLAAWP